MFIFFPFFKALGTGIGLSLLLNGEFYQGANGLIEGGHMIIEMDGRRCGCGQKGCIEAYASALNTASIFLLFYFCK